MEIEFRKADTADAGLLNDIYNSSFYNDYIKYGECPAYGKTKELMEQSIIDFPKFLILYNGRPVGCISCKTLENGVYEVGCLCVIPEFQRKGIGTAAMEFVKAYYYDWVRFTYATNLNHIGRKGAAVDNKTIVKLMETWINGVLKQSF